MAGIKNSLLKWSSYLRKGTTYGYASRKDCLVVFGFMLLLNFALRFLHSLACAALDMPSNINHSNDIPFIFLLLTIIANFSLMIMRINDVYGKRCFTEKIHIFALIVTCFLIGIFCANISKKFFDIQFGFIAWISLGYLCLFFILCAFPPSSKKREEMPVVEYKLPKKTIAVLVFIIFILFGVSLYGITLFTKITLADFVATENKYLPKMQDSEIRIDSVMALPNKTLMYVYTLVNSSKNKIDTNEFKKDFYPSLLDNTRHNWDLELFRRFKVTMIYLYRDKDGNEVIKFRFEHEDYRE
jgi:uncharacterized membrane protein YhaH (DUF805 family)